MTTDLSSPFTALAKERFGYLVAGPSPYVKGITLIELESILHAVAALQREQDAKTAESPTLVTGYKPSRRRAARRISLQIAAAIRSTPEPPSEPRP